MPVPEDRRTPHAAPPKHMVVREWLLAEISEGRLGSGTRTPTELELAARFGFSRQTIRQAIGSLESEGWLERHQGIGTFVSEKRPALRRPDRTVAVLTTYLDDYIFPDIIRGIERVLAPAGCALSLHITRNGTEREAECLRTILDRPVDALIAEGTKSAFPNPNLELYRRLADRGIPVLFINGGYSGMPFPEVLFDDEEAGRMAASWLLGLGHRELGGLFKVDDIQGHRRYAGFVRAHHEFGLHVREDRILWFTTEDMPQLSGPGYDGIFLHRFSGVTGICCYNDQAAVGAMETLRRLGLSVPADISVVGIDDSSLASLAVPKLTTVAHPRSVLGTQAGERILRMMDGESPFDSERLPPRLVVRDSADLPADHPRWPSP